MLRRYTYTWESQKRKLQHYRRLQPETSPLYQIVYHSLDELQYVWESKFQHHTATYETRLPRPSRCISIAESWLTEQLGFTATAASTLSFVEAIDELPSYDSFEPLVVSNVEPSPDDF